MFRNFSHSIVGKIMTGYVGIVLLALATTLVGIYFSWKDRKIDQMVSNAYYPMVLALKETQMLASESYKLTNNWIYQPSLSEKEKLRTIHSTDAAAKLATLSEVTDRFDDEVVEQSRGIQTTFAKLLEEQQIVMTKLSHDTSYSDDVMVDEAITAMDKKITPVFQSIDSQIEEASARVHQLLDEAKLQKQANANVLTIIYVSTILFFLVIGVVSARLSVKSIKKPIAELSDLITMLSRGKFASVTLKKGRDEIGRMAEAIEKMLDGLKKKVEFAENIGKGNYDTDFQLLSEEDTMGEALIQMRNNLKQAADDDRKRNWATEGLAKFADILQSRNDNLSELSDNIISNLVKYMGANQGALFLINDDNEQDSFIELVACYAYNRKKYLNKRIELGEGMTGQCVLERDTIYMSDIPDDYLRITSGLGDALPRNLLIVPLKINENIFGVVEIASFETIEPYQVDFVEKLGESIASTISSVKINSRTKRLLEETQMQAEQMRAQEEEMRQNMEELSATQEEMHRAQRRSEEALQEMKAKERDLYAMKSEFEAREAAVALTTLVTETDLHGNILYANDRFCEVSQFSRQEIVGRAHSVVRHPDMPSQLFEHCWTAIRKGNPFRAVFKNRKKSGEGFWVDCTIAAIKNENGDIVKYISTGHLIEDENIGLLLYNRRAESLEISQFETETI
jgi:PAS domain S-box-containing protein